MLFPQVIAAEQHEVLHAKKRKQLLFQWHYKHVSSLLVYSCRLGPNASNKQLVLVAPVALINLPLPSLAAKWQHYILSAEKSKLSDVFLLNLVNKLESNRKRFEANIAKRKCHLD